MTWQSGPHTRTLSSTTRLWLRIALRGIPIDSHVHWHFTVVPSFIHFWCIQLFHREIWDFLSLLSKKPDLAEPKLMRGYQPLAKQRWNIDTVLRAKHRLCASNKEWRENIGSLQRTAFGRYALLKLISKLLEHSGRSTALTKHLKHSHRNRYGRNGRGRTNEFAKKATTRQLDWSWSKHSWADT